MARTLLKERPKPPETRRVRFHAPAALVERMDALVAQAQEAGFDLDLDAALAEAYGGILRKLERELGDAGVAVEAEHPDATGDDTGTSTEARHAAASGTETAPADPNGGAALGTAA
jgi:hypothetical protein